MIGLTAPPPKAYTILEWCVYGEEERRRELNLLSTEHLPSITHLSFSLTLLIKVGGKCDHFIDHIKEQ